jgi:hypothetical protein
MTVRAPNGIPLPEIVGVASKVLREEADDLRATLDRFAKAGQPGCPWQRDDEAASRHDGPNARNRATLLLHTRHAAILTYVNAYDHLLTLTRALGGGRAMPIYSHASLSRVICEASVRFAWIMDSDISSEERITRGAVALYLSAEERLKGVHRLPPERFPLDAYQHMLDNSAAESREIQELITSAGLTFRLKENTSTKIRLELDPPAVSVPLKINVSDLMAELIPDSPSWYNVGSSVAHSHYWGLRDVNHSPPGQPMNLAPDVMNVGAAAESAISGAGLILDHCARMFGHNPTKNLKRTRARREQIDALMRRAVTSGWAHVPTEP